MHEYCLNCQKTGLKTVEYLLPSPGTAVLDAAVLEVSSKYNKPDYSRAHYAYSPAIYANLGEFVVLMA